MMPPDVIDGLPNLSGSEALVADAMAAEGAFYRAERGIAFDAIDSAFAIALHMHQPLVPAGGDDLRTAGVISHLRSMLAAPGSGDHHNATVFLQCYRRMGELIPRLLDEGARPRIMLDYSGCLLWGLRQMGADDVIDALRRVTSEPALAGCVEWLGTAWGHAVAPSTPVQDFRRHVRAWQHHFAALFGLEALARVRGFSPPEMALPNHPDVCYAFVRTLRDCGFRWVLVQEHSVERPGDGGPVTQPHLPHRLVARSSRGEVASIVAVLKTQGSDSKLVGQLQPAYEARGLGRQALAGRAVPPLVTQIADGENGGVMMNEFPSKYLEVMGEASHGKTPPVNVSEYLEYLASIGVRDEDLPVVQPVFQQRIWDRFEGAGPEQLAEVIAACAEEDGRFHMEGGSWTNDISWCRGYDQVLGPMEEASALFDRVVRATNASAAEHRYRNALFHLLMSQTSCYRYWGEGTWTAYGRELCRRTVAILAHDFDPG